MSERNTSFSDRQTSALPGLADNEPIQGGAERSCPADTGHSLNVTLRAFIRLFAQIVIDDLLAGSGEEVAHPTLQQSNTGPSSPEKELV